MSQSANRRRTEELNAANRGSAYWTEQKLSQARQRLTDRSAALRLDIQRELRKCGDELYGDLADTVADSGERSVSDLLNDVYLAEIDRDVLELRDVEAAQARLKNGTYGICADCGEFVDPIRIEYNPQVARCLGCQESRERPLKSQRLTKL